MRDKQDHATFDLPGFGTAAAPAAAVKRAPPARSAGPGWRQEQLELLGVTDASGLPPWRRDDQTDLSGLPVWAAA